MSDDTKQQHHAEPWKTGRKILRFVYASDETPICECDSEYQASVGQEEANARRIVACVNVASGVSDEVLSKIESHGGLSAMLARNLMNAIHDAKLTEQNDKLLAMLKCVYDNAKSDSPDMWGRVESLIAEIEATP